MQEFAAFTADLYRLADWLAECGVATVVMESTGVYWIPLFGVLEERGFEVMLVDPRRIKNRGQNGAHQQDLSFPPSRVGEQHCEGRPEYGYNGVGQGRAWLDL